MSCPRRRRKHKLHCISSRQEKCTGSCNGMAELDIVDEEADRDPEGLELSNAEDEAETAVASSPIEATPVPDDAVSKFLLENESFAKDWFARHASEDMVYEWLNSHGYIGDQPLSPMSQDAESSCGLVAEGSPTISLTDSYAQVTRSGRNSVTSELFQDIIAFPKRKRSINNYLANREQFHNSLRALDEPDVLMELIRDIANELDMDTLCHKILVNVSVLTNSDRGSLFLAKGSRGSRYLVAKLFDVTSDSVLQDALEAAGSEDKIPPIPFGVGLAGYVAETKNHLNIRDAYQRTEGL